MLRSLYFAVLRERLQREAEDLEAPPGTTVAELRALLARRHPELGSLLPLVQVAVNRSLASPDLVLHDGDEVAWLPPVSGGSDGPSGRVALLDRPLSLDQVVGLVAGEDCGAIATFTGTVRRYGRLAQVERLAYEAYRPMAEAVLGDIAREVESEWPGCRVAIHHRVGVLELGQAAVVIAVAAPHRAEAFAGCRAAIERLKERAPIWKKELGPDGQSWVGLGP